MPAPLASQSAPRPSRASDIYGGKLSAARFGAALALLLTTLAIACTHNNGSGRVANAALSQVEFSLGMPLP